MYKLNLYGLSLSPKTNHALPNHEVYKTMDFQNSTLSKQSESLLAVNSVLRNTYMLLGLSLLFSGLMAGVSMATGAAPMNPLITIVGYFGLLFLTNALRNSAWGIAAVFALTGFMGYTLGPILSAYIAVFSNGEQLIMTALGTTGLIFFALSGYVLTTRKNFSYMGGMLMVAAMGAFVLGIAGMVFNVPMLSLVVSALFVLVSSGLILYQTSEIIHGGERNYIMATVSLYVSLFNLFISLLNILGALSGRD